MAYIPLAGHKGKKNNKEEKLGKSHGDEDANGCIQAVKALHRGRVQWRVSGAKSSSEDESLCFLRIYSSYSSHCALANLGSTWKREELTTAGFEHLLWFCLLLFHHVPSFLCCGCSLFWDCGSLLRAGD